MLGPDPTSAEADDDIDLEEILKKNIRDLELKENNLRARKSALQAKCSNIPADEPKPVEVRKNCREGEARVSGEISNVEASLKDLRQQLKDLKSRHFERDPEIEKLIQLRRAAATAAATLSPYFNEVQNQSPPR